MSQFSFLTPAYTAAMNEEQRTLALGGKQVDMDKFLRPALETQARSSQNMYGSWLQAERARQATESQERQSTARNESSERVAAMNNAAQAARTAEEIAQRDRASQLSYKANTANNMSDLEKGVRGASLLGTTAYQMFKPTTAEAQAKARELAFQTGQRNAEFFGENPVPQTIPSYTSQYGKDPSLATTSPWGSTGSSIDGYPQKTGYTPTFGVKLEDGTPAYSSDEWEYGPDVVNEAGWQKYWEGFSDPTDFQQMFSQLPPQVIEAVDSWGQQIGASPESLSMITQLTFDPNSVFFSDDLNDIYNFVGIDLSYL